MQVQNQLRPANILHSFQKLPYTKQPGNIPILIRNTQDLKTRNMWQLSAFQVLQQLIYSSVASH